MYLDFLKDYLISVRGKIFLFFALVTLYIFPITIKFGSIPNILYSLLKFSIVVLMMISPISIFINYSETRRINSTGSISSSYLKKLYSKKFFLLYDSIFILLIAAIGFIFVFIFR